MNPCRRRPFVLAFVALSVLVVLAPSAAAQSRLDLGTITIPKDFDDRTSVLPKGEYGLVLRGEELSLVQKNWRNGLERVFGIATRVEDEAAEAEKPVVDIAETTADGRAVVRIRVLNARKSYTALLRVSSESGPRPSFTGTLDPAIARELALIREAHALLNVHAARIWPGWTSYQNLEFFVTFPNRAVLILTSRQRVPQSFESLAVPAVGSKRAYIDNSRALPGPIVGINGMSGRADYEGVSATLLGPVATSSGTMVGAASRPTAGRATAPAGPVVADGGGDLNRLLTYVHEAFHCLQMDFAVEAEKAGRRKNRGRPNPSFEPTVDSEVYAELEGEALLRAHRAPDRAAALEHLRDAVVARELRHKAMPEGAVVYDVVRTRAEGTATYANIRAALLVQEQGRPRADAGADASVLEAAYKGLPAYIQAQTADRLARVKGSSNASDERLYTYGAYQAMVLDRVFPDWKTGLFEDDRTLDEVLAERLALTPGDRDAAMGRFTRLYGAEEVRARHGAAVKAREDAIAAVRGRQGRTYRVDVRQAQRNVDIRPRPGAIFVPAEQIYPHGLEGLTYGSLRLTSKDTPMRMRGQFFEWVDTEPSPGDKGYDLKCEAQESDLFRTVTVTTKGFSFTAKAVRVTDDGKVVTFAIVD